MDFSLDLRGGRYNVFFFGFCAEFKAEKSLSSNISLIWAIFRGAQEN
ncbi:MAG: hypothetical protein Ct9H300mP21_03150 [Pseudomonadota bacterium]|nr:MAG: hypothetical protein Ct9H300mP21_03150 [Pseudomonadota bacterium]